MSNLHIYVRKLFQLTVKVLPLFQKKTITKGKLLHKISMFLNLQLSTNQILEIVMVMNFGA